MIRLRRPTIVTSTVEEIAAAVFACPSVPGGAMLHRIARSLGALHQCVCKQPHREPFVFRDADGSVWVLPVSSFCHGSTKGSAKALAAATALSRSATGVQFDRLRTHACDGQLVLSKHFVSLFPFLRMETSKRKASTKEADGSQDASRAPLKSFRVDEVSASIFAREHNGKTFYSVSFSRSYKDNAGQFQYTKNFDADDLGKVVTVAQQTAEFLRNVSQDAK